MKRKHIYSALTFALMLVVFAYCVADGGDSAMSREECAAIDDEANRLSLRVGMGRGYPTAEEMDAMVEMAQSDHDEYWGEMRGLVARIVQESGGVPSQTVYQVEACVARHLRAALHARIPTLDHEPKGSLRAIEPCLGDIGRFNLWDSTNELYRLADQLGECVELPDDEWWLDMRKAIDLDYIEAYGADTNQWAEAKRRHPEQLHNVNFQKFRRFRIAKQLYNQEIRRFRRKVSKVFHGRIKTMSNLSDSEREAVWEEFCHRAKKGAMLERMLNGQACQVED